MVLRTWGKALLAALGVAAAAGAGQLGIAYGLGIVRLDRNFLGNTAHEWPAQLAWVAWIAALAALTGAYLGGRVAERSGIRLDLTARAAVAMVAGLGATAVAPLSMHPARAAQVVGSIDAVLTVGLTAALAAVGGAFGAVAALSNRAVHWSVSTVAGIGWVLALVSVAPSLGPLDPLPFVRLAVLDLPGLSAGTTRMLALIGIPTLMLLVGAAIAGLARWLDRPLMTMVLGGTGGPALLAVAYVLAGPGDAREQAAPYWGSIIGLAAGVLGAVAIAVLPTPGAAAAEPPTQEQIEPADDATPATGTTGATTATPADDDEDEDDEATAPLPSTAGMGGSPGEPTLRSSTLGPYLADSTKPEAEPATDRPRRGPATRDRAKRGRAEPADRASGTTGDVTADLGRPDAADPPPAGRRQWLPRLGRGDKRAAKPRAAKPPAAAKPTVAEHDEDYVNWVSGLGGGNGPTSRRTTGRETEADTGKGGG